MRDEREGKVARVRRRRAVRLSLLTMATTPLRLTRAQVREIDRLAIERFHIPGIVLMENAARGAAEVAWEMLGRKTQTKVQIVCGGGNNGGDGLAIARHLHNLGVVVTILLSIDPDKYSGDALINWKIVQAMNLPIAARTQAADAIQSAKADLIIDALFGTGLTQSPRPDASALIGWMNHREVPILAVDLPSGMDCDSGLSLGEHCVRAQRTVTFVAEKWGFAHPWSRQYTGKISVADIGCPKELSGGFSPS